MKDNSLVALDHERIGARVTLERRAFLSKDELGGQTLSDEHFGTRFEDGEPRLPVLLLSSISIPNKKLVFLDGTSMTVGKGPLREQIAKILDNSVQVPASAAPVTNYDDVSFLDRLMFFGNSKAGPIPTENMKARVGLVDKKEVYTLRGDRCGKDACYNRTEGYTYTINKKKRR